MPNRPRAVNTDRAQVSQTPDGATVINDPDANLTVQLWVTPTRRLRRLLLDARPGYSLSAATLCRLPLTQMTHIAATVSAVPDEIYHRMRARPRTGRTWDDDHWDRVLDVYQWARRVRRPGGGRRAIADLWGVSINPTVDRWLAEARRRAQLQAAPS